MKNKESLTRETLNQMTNFYQVIISNISQGCKGGI